MTKQILNDWYKLVRQVKNGYHMSEHDYRELIRLNGEVMEVAHDIHNNNMLRKDK